MAVEIDDLYFLFQDDIVLSGYREVIDRFDQGRDVSVTRPEDCAFHDSSTFQFEYQAWLFGVALALWETGQVSAAIEEELTRAIERGAGTTLYDDVDARQAKAFQVVKSFTAQLRKPRSPPRVPRAIEPVSQLVYELGDVLRLGSVTGVVARVDRWSRYATLHVAPALIEESDRMRLLALGGSIYTEAFRHSDLERLAPDIEVVGRIEPFNESRVICYDKHAGPTSLDRLVRRLDATDARVRQTSGLSSFIQRVRWRSLS